MDTKNFLNSENTVREAYEAPKCEIIEMQQEGVLCGSGRINPYEEDDFVW
ncbi:unknown [Bacteroides sp. CAG:598]|nr:unknown [Bacteroides sp. CAG:598]